MEQEVFILYDNCTEYNLEELNKKLKDGWRVKSTTPMGGGGASYKFVAVFVLEKEK